MTNLLYDSEATAPLETTTINSCGIAMSMAGLFAEAYHEAGLRLSGKIDGLQEILGKPDNDAVVDPRIRALKTAIEMTKVGEDYFSSLTPLIKNLSATLTSSMFKAVHKRNFEYMADPKNAALLKILGVKRK